MIFESIIGGGLGALARLAPEAFKFFDRKNERKHELEMQKQAVEMQKVSGQQRLAEIEANAEVAMNTGALDALKEAIASEGKLTGNSFIDAFTKLVRPFITYAFMGAYLWVKIAGYHLLVEQGVAAQQAIIELWTPNDMALFSGIINFWFLGRVFERNK